METRMRKRKYYKNSQYNRPDNTTELKVIPNFPNYMISTNGRITHCDGDVISYVKPCLTKGGYFIVNIKDANNYRHRRSVHSLVAITFLEHTPCGHTIVVDHINNVKTDNRLENLQLISHRLNTSKDARNRTGHTGVSRHKGRYRVGLSVHGKQKWLGTFDTAIEASEAYQDKVAELNAEIEN